MTKREGDGGRSETVSETGKKEEMTESKREKMGAIKDGGRGREKEGSQEKEMNAFFYRYFSFRDIFPTLIPTY